MQITPYNIKELKENEVFVFGSNESGRHGKGAAKTAMKWGAKYGKGEGLFGRTYALPTKASDVRKTLSISKIKKYINNFEECVNNNKNLHFLITEVGCGLAGYLPEDIGPLFSSFINLDNVSLPESFIKNIKN